MNAYWSHRHLTRILIAAPAGAAIFLIDVLIQTPALAFPWITP